MSGRLNRPARQDQLAGDLRARMPLLDRLLDDRPADRADPPLSASEAHRDLMTGVRRDLEALLNARRPWRSLPAGYESLLRSPLGYGLPDFAAGAFNQAVRREGLRTDVQQALALFERRFTDMRIQLAPTTLTDPTLRLSIKATLHADPAPAPVGFDINADPRTDNFQVNPGRDV